MNDKKDSKDGVVISNNELEKDRKVRKSSARGRPKGLPKTGGRQKGPSKEELNKAAWDDVLRQNMFNIPREAIKLFFDKDTSNSLKFSILQFLAQYTTPAIKPKDQEDSAPSEVEHEPADILSIVNGK